MKQLTVRQKDQTFHVTHVGDGHRSFMLITAKPLSGMQVIDKANVLIDESIYEDFKEWLGGELVNDSVQALGATKARVGRMRQGLGVTKFTKPGSSSITRWRRTGATHGLLSGEAAQTISSQELSEAALSKAEKMAEGKEDTGESTKVYAYPHGSGHKLTQINFLDPATPQYEAAEEKLLRQGWKLIDW